MSCCIGRLRSSCWPAPLSHFASVSYTHLRAHETKANLVCRLLLEKKKDSVEDGYGEEDTKTFFFLMTRLPPRSTLDRSSAASDVYKRQGIASVGFSQQAAGEAAAVHLLQQGRKRLAYVAAQLDPRVMQRGEGFRRALQAAGVYDPALELLHPCLLYTSPSPRD